MDPLEGLWRVERDSGLLPPKIMSKRIGGGWGTTRIAGVPLLPFREQQDGSPRRRSLVYWGLPLRDELELAADGTWSGRGFVFGRQFCRFHLRPLQLT